MIPLVVLLMESVANLGSLDVFIKFKSIAREQLMDFLYSGIILAIYINRFR